MNVCCNRLRNNGDVNFPTVQRLYITQFTHNDCMKTEWNVAGQLYTTPNQSVQQSLDFLSDFLKSNICKQLKIYWSDSAFYLYYKSHNAIITQPLIKSVDYVFSVQNIFSASLNIIEHFFEFVVSKSYRAFCL